MHDKSPVGPTWQAPRRYPRFPLQTKVELRVENQILMATTDNVSAGGLLVECDPVLPRGTEMQLRFNLPNGFYVETPARVAHAKSGYGMGLEMLGLTHEAREEISELARRIIGYTRRGARLPDRKSTRLNSSHLVISYAVFCLKKKKHIADSILFGLPPINPRTRVAVDTLLTTRHVPVAGEVTTTPYAAMPTIVRDVIVTIDYY